MEIVQAGEAVRFGVLVQPRASRSEIVGVQGGALKVRVAAPPVDGAANEELARVLARRLRVPRSAVRLARGETGRRKLIEVRGLTASQVRALLLEPEG
jgi:hypothetical protein